MPNVQPRDLCSWIAEGTDKLTSRLVPFSVHTRIMWPPHNSKTQRHVVPQGQASRSENSVVFGRYQMPPQIEQTVDNSVHAQKPLSLMRRLESPHASLSNSGWLMGKLGSVIGVLGGIVDRIRDEFAVSDAITPQLVGDNASGFTATNEWR